MVSVTWTKRKWKWEKITSENPFHLCGVHGTRSVSMFAPFQDCVWMLHMWMLRVSCPESLIRRCLCIEYTKWQRTRSGANRAEINLADFFTFFLWCCVVQIAHVIVMCAVLVFRLAHSSLCPLRRPTISNTMSCARDAIHRNTFLIEFRPLSVSRFAFLFILPCAFHSNLSSCVSHFPFAYPQQIISLARSFCLTLRLTYKHFTFRYFILHSRFDFFFFLTFPAVWWCSVLTV